MLNLIRAINTKLNESGYNVFYNEKPKEIDYPFVIFNMRNTNKLENREDIFLDVDIWTKNQVQVFVMTKTIDDLLQRYKYIDNNLQFSIYKINQLNNLADEDKTIKRNQLKYIIKKYERNVV